MIMVVVAVAGILVTAAMGLSVLRTNLLEDRKAKIEDIVKVAVEALEADYQNSRKAGLSDADTIAHSKTILRSMQFGKNDYIYVFAPNGQLEVHPNSEGKSLYNAVDSDGIYFARRQIEIAANGGGFLSYRYPRAAGGDPIPKISYVVQFKPYNWTVGGGIYIDDVDAIFWSEVIRMGMLFGVTLLLVVGMSFWMGRTIVSPINAMTGAMRKIASGDIATAIPAQDRRDEVGVMAQSVQVFKDSMIEANRLRGEQDVLKASSEADRQRLMFKMADDFEAGVSSSLDMLSSAAGQMRTTSEGMSSTAQQTSAQANTVAAAAEQASANVQTVAAATEELSSSISEISRQVGKSTTIAGQAVQQAQLTNVTIQGLSEAARKIGDVVSLISDIASQTNLLALNATIEAARAGEAGKGFAVVASEVKSLASQTAKATEEIASQIGSMQGATSEAVEAIQVINSTINAMNEIATAIASAVEEQGAATAEIARNVQEAAQGTSKMSSNIFGVNQAADKTGIAANEVLVSAEQLSLQTATLRNNVDGFLDRIRAA
ncbi:MAG: cache domain-containing protein [Xanthobacteraceae bacterium]|nr:cache domain-containing protein [Xanthobacteraceae bacterium]